MIFGSPQSLPYWIAAVVIAITMHEYAHAWTADRLGDPTPRSLGRLSLNPLVHLDPLGSLLLVTVGFGWAKPVPVDPRYFSDWRRGMLVVAAAGPLSNITLLFVVGLLAQVRLLPQSGPAGTFVVFLGFINAILAVFNLLPLPPLDGSRILAGLLPPAQATAYDRLAPYGPPVLLALIMLPWIIPGLSLFRLVLRPAYLWLFARAFGAAAL
jgi:Zn-dependent protease